MMTQWSTNWHWVLNMQDIGYLDAQSAADCSPAGDVCSNPIMGTAYNSTLKEKMQVVMGHFDDFRACVLGYIHKWNLICNPIEVKKEAPLGYSCPTSLKEQINYYGLNNTQNPFLNH